MLDIDWNGNGEHDAFDTFMDMEIASELSNDSEANHFNNYCCDVGSDEYYSCNIESSTGNHDSAYEVNENTVTSFQDELKQNLRSPKTVEEGKTQKALDSAMAEAKSVLYKIKKKLIQNAQNAQYLTQNGVTTVSCVDSIPQHFLRRRHSDNNEQIIINQKTSFLMRDRHLIYRSWVSFDVEPQYSSEFSLFMTTLKKVAKQENINIDCVIHDMRENTVYPFPTDITNAFGVYALSVKASINICDETTNLNTDDNSNTNPPIKTQPIETIYVEKEETYKDLSNKNESDGDILLKSIIVIILCVIAFAICIAGDFGKLGMAVILIGAAIGGYYILKS